MPARTNDAAERGFTLWFTGFSGAGKSTVSQRVKELLNERGRHIEVLDGDEVRENLSKGLGFSKEDRDINIKRIAYVAKLLTRNGAAVITAAISPYRATRAHARTEIGPNFIEVFVDCPIEECIRRDVKGLYKKAIAGEIKQFTGISDPYESPEDPEVTLHTDRESVEQSAQRVITYLEARGLLPSELNVNAAGA